MPRPLPPGTWPKASDEADGNTGRPQPGFFRITGKKYFVLHRSHTGKKLFRTLPITGEKYFVLYRKDIFGLYLLVGGRKPYRLPITLASSLSPLNVPKTGFPWSIPPDLARLTPSDRYPELDNNYFSPFRPVQGLSTRTPPNSRTSSPEGVILCVRSLAVFAASQP